MEADAIQVAAVHCLLCPAFCILGIPMFTTEVVFYRRSDKTLLAASALGPLMLLCQLGPSAGRVFGSTPPVRRVGGQIFLGTNVHGLVQRPPPGQTAKRDWSLRKGGRGHARGIAQTAATDVVPNFMLRCGTGCWLPCCRCFVETCTGLYILRPHGLCDAHAFHHFSI